ncbi:MAG TPA: PIG-L family deacetylase [Planctomycetota bacterium]|nr:PIG-L family deacetylase [Planctomycetota bacterium]
MPKTLLMVGAHADDCEIGAGGVLLQAVAAGCRVVVVTVVSDYSTWALTAGREAATKAAFTGIARKYGYEKLFLDYPYHQIDGNDVELKKKLSRLYNEIRPDVGFIHHHEDNYTDHVACHHAGSAAMLFPHGLSGDLKSPRIERLYAYTVTPWQTYRFEPDAFYDVGPVMPLFMDLLNDIDAAYFGKTVEELIHHDLTSRNDPTQSLKLGSHSWTKFADCIEHGSRFGCRYAQGFKQVWGNRPGAPLW